MLFISRSPQSINFGVICVLNRQSHLAHVACYRQSSISGLQKDLHVHFFGAGIGGSNTALLVLLQSTPIVDIISYSFCIFTLKF